MSNSKKLKIFKHVVSIFFKRTKRLSFSEDYAKKK